MTKTEPSKAPITVIIPTKNEICNIEACLLSVQFCDQIFLVDSGSTDGTTEIGERLNAEVRIFKYEGGWPKKRQWAMDTLDIRNPWMLLLDADEVISNNLKDELISISLDSDSSDGYWITLRMFFLGRVLRYGASGLTKLSFFRTGKGRFEQRLTAQDSSMADMEIHEHVIVDGTESRCQQVIFHHNVNSLDRYIQKHNEYSNWDSALFIQRKHGTADKDAISADLFGNQSQRRRWLKQTFFVLPGFPLIVFIYFYIFRLGFFDGRQGLIYCTFQAVQYFHIRAKIVEIKLKSKSTRSM